MWFVLVLGLMMPSPFSMDALRKVAVQQASSTPAEEPAPINIGPSSHHELWPYLALGAGQGADVASSIIATRDLRLEEKNPLGLKGTLALKGLTVPLAAALMHHDQSTGHQTAARVIGLLGAGLGGANALWNVHEMHKVREN